jgi:sugar fermentation stimulation protein A
MLVHSFEPLLLGTLIKRYKRFFADIQLENGEIITAHCPNTGPMTGISEVGSLVAVSRSDNPKRKLAFTWEMVQVQGFWVGVNTSLPNRVIGKMLERKLIAELGEYDRIQAEVAYGVEKSRIDFVLFNESGKESSKTFLEVKNTTWVADSQEIVLFPDTVSTRGQKHLRELISIIDSNSENSIKSTMLYFINRSDPLFFSPGDRADPEYGKLLRMAIAAGVQVLACRFHVTPQAIEYLGLAELKIS